MYFNTFDEYSVIVTMCDVLCFRRTGIFSSIVTFKLFHQPKGGKRRIQVNDLCVNIDILRTWISMYSLWTKILHILLYHYSRICRFPMLHTQNVYSCKTYLPITYPEWKPNLPATPTDVTITYFQLYRLEKRLISHISTMN